MYKISMKTVSWHATQCKIVFADKVVVSYIEPYKRLLQQDHWYDYSMNLFVISLPRFRNYSYVQISNYINVFVFTIKFSSMVFTQSITDSVNKCNFF